uniref:Testis expressed 19 n=1 Tax=Lynx canadensis TaxID=61383 RepID=A0A667HWA3_LYNCA
TCPPVSVRYGDEGVSYLRASWMYQLRHGDQLGTCFACFKAAFLELRDSLEPEDWEEGDWDPEPTTDPAGAGPEQGWGPGVGLSWGQGQGHPAQEGSVEWGSPPPHPGSEEEGPDHHLAPTELEPQDAAPRGLGPEDADWTQSLPWRLGWWGVGAPPAHAGRGPLLRGRGFSEWTCPRGSPRCWSGAPRGPWTPPRPRPRPG